MSTYQCARCGAKVGDMQLHNCSAPPGLPNGLPIGVPIKLPEFQPNIGEREGRRYGGLTEEDVRRIVREEISKARTEGQVR